jgi:hypothetical protein
MVLDPHVAAILAGTSIAGLLMAFSGIQKSALEWKRRRRICPSCGREAKTCLCA